MAKKALCIGINNYPGTHMDLQGCVNDAQDWSAVLTARGYKTTLLLDDKATKAARVTAWSSPSRAMAPTSLTKTATRSTASTRRSAPTTCRPRARR